MIGDGIEQLAGDPSDGLRIVLVAAPAGLVARELARAVVGEGLAACVNVVDPVHSVYRWKGLVEEADAALLVIKAPASAVALLRSRIVELHPYEVPEFVVLAATDVLPAYLSWVLAETPGGAS